MNWTKQFERKIICTKSFLYGRRIVQDLDGHRAIGKNIRWKRCKTSKEGEHRHSGPLTWSGFLFTNSSSSYSLIPLPYQKKSLFCFASNSSTFFLLENPPPARFLLWISLFFMLSHPRSTILPLIGLVHLHLSFLNLPSVQSNLASTHPRKRQTRLQSMIFSIPITISTQTHNFVQPL